MFPKLEGADRVQMSLVFTDGENCYVPLHNVFLQGYLFELQVKSFHCKHNEGSRRANFITQFKDWSIVLSRKIYLVEIKKLFSVLQLYDLWDLNY